MTYRRAAIHDLARTLRQHPPISRTGIEAILITTVSILVLTIRNDRLTIWWTRRVRQATARRRASLNLLDV